MIGLLVSAAQAAGETRIAPNDSRLYFVGRFDRRDPPGPRCEWTASAVTLRVHGIGVLVDIVDSGDAEEFQLVGDSISCGYGNKDSRHVRGGDEETN